MSPKINDLCKRLYDKGFGVCGGARFKLAKGRKLSQAAPGLDNLSQAGLIAEPLRKHRLDKTLATRAGTAAR